MGLGTGFGAWGFGVLGTDALGLRFLWVTVNVTKPGGTWIKEISPGILHALPEGHKDNGER